MDTTTLIYSIIIVIVLLIIGILAYYYLPPSSWTDFTLNYGDTFKSSAVANSLTGINPANLRWRNCIFTIVNNGKTYTTDVTDIMNSTSSVYLYFGKTTISYDLIRPLNYHSFPVSGFTAVAPNAKACLGDADCNSTYANNICVKQIPAYDTNSGNAAITSTNCSFYGGTSQNANSINPASNPSLSIAITTTDTGVSYQFPTVPSQYVTAQPYNALYCKSNGDGKTYTVDWLQLAPGICALSGLYNSGDSVKLTGSFKVFPFL